MKSGGSNVKYRGMIQTAIGIAREEVGFIIIFHLLSLNVIDLQEKRNQWEIKEKSD